MKLEPGKLYKFIKNTPYINTLYTEISGVSIDNVRDSDIVLLLINVFQDDAITELVFLYNCQKYYDNFSTSSNHKKDIDNGKIYKEVNYED